MSLAKVINTIKICLSLKCATVFHNTFSKKTLNGTQRRNDT